MKNGIILAAIVSVCLITGCSSPVKYLRDASPKTSSEEALAFKEMAELGKLTFQVSDLNRKQLDMSKAGWQKKAVWIRFYQGDYEYDYRIIDVSNLDILLRE